MRKGVRAVENEAATVGERDAPCQCVGGGEMRLKAETAVILLATGAGTGVDLAAHEIEVVAADAAKRSAPAFALKAGMIAAIVVEPKAKKHGCDQRTVDE
jgi:hypothetical protein